MRVGLKAAKFFVGSFVPFVGGGRYLLQEVEMKTFMVLAMAAFEAGAWLDFIVGQRSAVRVFARIPIHAIRR
jgi:hypothetical protein